MRQKLGAILVEHRSILGDGAIIAAVMAIAGALLFLFDLQGHLSIDRRVDLDELLVLGLILGLALSCFGLRRIVAQEREIGRRIQAEARARFLAHHDHLTGLPNRRQLQQALDAAIALPPSAEMTHALLLLDLNGFKAVNDTHGHAAGDEVLSVVATRLSATLRSGDMLARMGGDEFAVVLHDVRGHDGTADIASEMIASLMPSIAIGSVEHSVGTGIGITLIPTDGSHAGDLMRKADVALYTAKAMGDSSFAFFRDEMESDARDRDRMQRALTAAIADDEIAPFYQPIVDLGDRRDTGVRGARAVDASDDGRHLAGPLHPPRGAKRPDTRTVGQASRAGPAPMPWPGLAPSIFPSTSRP